MNESDESFQGRAIAVVPTREQIQNLLAPRVFLPLKPGKHVQTSLGL